MPDPAPTTPEPTPSPTPGSNPGTGDPTQSTTDPAPEPTPTPGQQTLGGGGGDQTPDPNAQDWRAALAGDNADAMKTLGRFKSAGDFMTAFQNAQEKIRSGQAKGGEATAGPPENASDEELATWRKENGIPDDPKGYLDNLPDGMVIGEMDQPAMESFAKAMHEGNVAPAEVNKALAWYQDWQQEVIQETRQNDLAFQGETVEALRSEWGADYKANLSSALNFLKSTMGEDAEGNSLADLLLGGRTADGRLMGDHPEVLRWLAGLAHEQNPAGFVAPGSGLTQEQSITNEITEIETLMRTKPQEYFKDEAKQARLRTLYEARQKLGGS